MFNTQVKNDDKPSSATPDELVRDSDATRKLQFEGTVEVEGTFSGQVLNALFGPDSQVNGKLHFEGAVQIDGTFNGSITTNDLLIIGDHAKIAADINCGSAVVSGEVTGNITASGAVELRKGAHVKGDIATPTLGIDKGALFDGLSKMVSAPGTFGSLERRSRRETNEVR
jgi:cytoskeletal protein CcmA (bactofilin family)